MLFGSRRAADLRRDARILVPAFGAAVEAHSYSAQDGYAEQIRSRLGWEPTPGRFHLFRVDIHDVTFIR